MASTLWRVSANLARKNVLFSCIRASSGTPAGVDPMKGKVASDRISMPDGLGHAVGPERWELLAKLAGHEDPFEMNVKKRGKGSFVEPNIVPSMYDYRLVGCVCDEDAISIHWLHLHKGEPKRCECGHWFRLDELKPFDLGV